MYNTYTYSTSDWGDVLSAFKGQSITYDQIGNPLSYYNGSRYTFTWDETELAGAVFSGNSYTFTYNDDGIRTSKTKNGVTTTYYLNGTQVVAEETNGNTTVYLYDADGLPLGMRYHGSIYAETRWDVYWFEKNIFGDVVAVYDGQGFLRVSYTYNAWGYATVTYHGCDATSTAAKNPIRYRGYYYDKNLVLYYLQSRYYDPVLCRFISPASALSVTSESLDGLNLYVYANNNPVSFAQSSLSSKTTKVARALTQLGGTLTDKYGDSGFSYVDLSGIGNVYAFGSTAFSITSFVIGKVRGAKGLQQFEALITTGKVVAGVGCVLNVGLSIYGNCTDASLSTQEKWINSTVDTIHNVGQTVGSYCLAFVPYAGPALSIIGPIIVDAVWYAELNVAGFTLEINWLKIDGKSIEELVKEMLNELIN